MDTYDAKVSDLAKDSESAEDHPHGKGVRGDHGY